MVVTISRHVSRNLRNLLGFGGMELETVSKTGDIELWLSYLSLLLCLSFNYLSHFDYQVGEVEPVDLFTNRPDSPIVLLQRPALVLDVAPAVHE